MSHYVIVLCKIYAKTETQSLQHVLVKWCWISKCILNINHVDRCWKIHSHYIWKSLCFNWMIQYQMVIFKWFVSCLQQIIVQHISFIIIVHSFSFSPFISLFCGWLIIPIFSFQPSLNNLTAKRVLIEDCIKCYLMCTQRKLLSMITVGYFWLRGFLF